MNSQYNIHGLALNVSAKDSLIAGLMADELRAFRSRKRVPGALTLEFKTLPARNGKPLTKEFLRKNCVAQKIMTRKTLTHYYRQNLITTVTHYKEKKIETEVAAEPSLFPDPACYFCLTQPVSPWLKKRGLFFLHAGCVSENGRGVLVVGDSGAGKSTLTVSAIRGGFKLISDEQPLLSLEKKAVIARAFPRRIRIDRVPAGLFPELRPVLKSSKAERLVFHAADIWPKALGESWCRPEVVIFPRFGLNNRLRVKKIHASGALARLLQDEHLVWYQDGPWKNLSRLHLELLNRLAAGTRAYEMTYGVKDILKIPSVFRKLLHG